MSDRTIHGRSQSGGEIVRYDGKWYVEYVDPPQRLPITIGDAVLFATVEGAQAFLGRPGGSRFDARVKAAHAPDRDSLRRERDEAIRLLANATDPENEGDWDEAREVGWAWARERDDA